MRLTEFWKRMNAYFGEAYAESFAKDHVMSELDGLTVSEALASGWDAKTVWQVVCDNQGVPATLR
ncbi:DUF3046 domain-containing protein [Streptacidiphilus monticola]|jgi:hypothetical protein|uniref:DUF3046 domain-containing protein n=1 Tax=Streptacidiphilus monticola TaxID=2161674 RepID=A0ABW1G617_9ACTN